MCRLGSHGIADVLILCALLLHPSTGHTQPVGSDIFSSQGEHDRFAVGGAHRWYDNHTTEAKQKSSHCLSILDEAKAFQDQGLALDEQARQPGLDSRQATALRKQANEQFRLREKKVRAFIECFNQANRQKSPPSDQFATGGNTPRGDNPQAQPGTTSPSPRKRGGNGQKQLPGPDQKPSGNDPGKQSDVFSTKGDTTPSDDVQTQAPTGDKAIKRTRKLPDGPSANVNETALKKTIDDCFQEYLPSYAGTDWHRFSPDMRRVASLGPFRQSFDLSGAAADQIIAFTQARYGDDSDRELTPDYLIGWLTNCLMNRNVLPRQDPRILYRRYMEAYEPSDNMNKKRITRRFEEFGYGFRLYPSIPPFWDHDTTGSPRSESDTIPTTPRANMRDNTGDQGCPSRLSTGSEPPIVVGRFSFALPRT